MEDLSFIIGDASIDGQTAERLADFIRRRRIEVTAPARWHTAGWVWTGRVGEADELAGGDTEPIKVLSVPGPSSPLVIAHVLCLAMRGRIDHVLRMDRPVIMPTADPAEIRAELCAGKHAWFGCPFADRVRCICIPPDGRGEGMHNPDGKGGSPM
jgi:hypothetical protein